jgi:small multidrug resistance pump
MGYLFLSIAIVSEVAGTAALKASAEFTRPIPSLIVLVGYGIAFVCLALTLRTIPVGIAYAIWAGCGIVLVALASYALFEQKLDAPAIVGIGLIAAGVVVVNVFSGSVAH